MIELKLEQGTAEWFKARSGKVTGSILKSAVGAPGPQLTLTYDLLAQRMAEVIPVDLTSDAVLRGVAMEEFAVERACKDLQYDFRKAGFLQSDEPGLEQFGMSPDSVLEQGGIIVGGIETKCPNSKKHIEYIMKNLLPNEYMHQVYSPFLVSDDIKWWFFMSYDDRVYQQQTFYHLVRRETIQGELDVMKIKLKKFLVNLDEYHTNLIF